MSDRTNVCRDGFGIDGSPISPITGNTEGQVGTIIDKLIKWIIGNFRSTSVTCLIAREGSCARPAVNFDNGICPSYSPLTNRKKSTIAGVVEREADLERVSIFSQKLYSAHHREWRSDDTTSQNIVNTRSTRAGNLESHSRRGTGKRNSATSSSNRHREIGRERRSIIGEVIITRCSSLLKSGRNRHRAKLTRACEYANIDVPHRIKGGTIIAVEQIETARSLNIEAIGSCP